MALRWNLPSWRSCLQLFLFSPVGYYFLTRFDNYFINQERLNKSLKIQLSDLLEPTGSQFSDLGDLHDRRSETKAPLLFHGQFCPSVHSTPLALGKRAPGRLGHTRYAKYLPAQPPSY